jgi:hypothetical protein
MKQLIARIPGEADGDSVPWLRCLAFASNRTGKKFLHRPDGFVFIVSRRFDVQRSAEGGAEEHEAENASRVGHARPQAQPNGGMESLRQPHQSGRRQHVQPPLPSDCNACRDHERLRASTPARRSAFRIWSSRFQYARRRDKNFAAA